MERGLVDGQQGVEQVTASDALAFESIVASYEAPIARYLYGMVGDVELARDLTQETFLSAYRALPSTPITNLSGWLYRIATNHALSYFRRKRLIGWIPLSRLTESGYDPSVDSHSDWVVTNSAVQEALEQLDPKDRACLLLRAAGFSGQEIAEQLGCSPGAARTRLSRAREAFRRAYHRDDPDDIGDTDDTAEGR
ncbi:sigma-70 family RNA polymerase sigma factor [Sphaerobacter sp.]|uniref:RNA polymerase sigma factor n=1 Tax=Sphaerobacter sp. TaxID=2099654 RepID=UPI001D8F11BE|nr:sigma-70 family RNA polymerase sigma factor [Sphaerobacter sp.]MBX5446765.1 sigma-70 family RNA polymerase sigma factor [Sphaerobacter sp.]